MFKRGEKSYMISVGFTEDKMRNDAQSIDVTRYIRDQETRIEMKRKKLNF